MRSESFVATYTVHEPPEPGSDRIDRGAELEFVKDGFSWLTAIFPPIGLLAKGLWLALIAYLVGIGLLVWLLETLKVDGQWIGLVVSMIGIYLGFEASTLKRWKLERAGWRTLGVVNGRSIAECERRFLEGWLPGQPVIAGASTSAKRESSLENGLGKSRVWPFGSKA
jgi:hypothetical protein